MSIIAVDFFCGIGGATKGLQQAGIRVAKGIDIDEGCKKTYEDNCAPAKFVKADIWRISSQKVMEGVALGGEDRLMFVACPPCQPFSPYVEFDRVDKRTRLSSAFLRSVKKHRPDYLIMENVPGFENAFGGGLLRSFLRVLDDFGYRHVHRVIDAKRYGIPQTRKRFLLLASRHEMPTFPTETHGPDGIRYTTVRDAIAHYPPIGAGELHPEVPNHETQFLSRKNLARIRATPENGGGRKSWPKRLRLECHLEDGVGHTDVYGRMRWDSPAPTLTTRCISLSNGRFGHPEQDRAITVREAATLQGFDNTFVFYELKSPAARHIGNAVPPPLMRILGKALAEQPPIESLTPQQRLAPIQINYPPRRC